MWLEVHARSTGVHYRGPAVAPGELTFDVALERLVVGVPSTALPVGAAALVLVLVRLLAPLQPSANGASADSSPTRRLQVAALFAGRLLDTAVAVREPPPSSLRRKGAIARGRPAHLQKQYI